MSEFGHHEQSDYKTSPILQEPETEIRRAIESGIWPEEYFATLLSPVVEWAAEHPTSFHHTGFTFPDRTAFEAATSRAPGQLIVNNLTMPAATHQRRYIRFSGKNGADDTFIELHMVGESGNGVLGIHFDFITEDATGLLAHIKAAVDCSSMLLNTNVIAAPFGGGNAPVGKVELQPTETPHLTVGVMARTHWSDPEQW